MDEDIKDYVDEINKFEFELPPTKLKTKRAASNCVKDVAI